MRRRTSHLPAIHLEGQAQGRRGPGSRTGREEEVESEFRGCKAATVFSRKVWSLWYALRKETGIGERKKSTLKSALWSGSFRTQHIKRGRQQSYIRRPFEMTAETIFSCQGNNDGCEMNNPRITRESKLLYKTASDPLSIPANSADAWTSKERSFSVFLGRVSRYLRQSISQLQLWSFSV